jgi:hypothetical protein
MYKYKIFSLFFLITISSIYCQNVNILSDVDSLKLELFEAEFHKLDISKRNEYLNFNIIEEEDKYILNDFRDKNILKISLKKHLPKLVFESLYKLRGSNWIKEMLTSTNWNKVFKGKKVDSVVFIRPHKIDDYFFCRDSINNIYKFDYIKSLFSISPFIFEYTENKHKTVYAIVSNSQYTIVSNNNFSGYGDQGHISLYIRKENKWVFVKELYRWSPYG